eukprot:TRINITY_DN67406_c0_g1_i1.p1 TRINITY_DN67406_c0_g1~~TRINITY_DN67406_c0_g1_i1.p1  ORF type:complete len:1008 (+),score=163.09 TRINITY_DN67406_c0_g1_i1:421-3024(+)
MVVFSVEIYVCSWGKPGYFLGFFFFLDIVSTVTLVLDVSVVSEHFFGDAISNWSSGDTTTEDDGSSSDSAEAARAARMSRAGTKAGRIVRLVRLVRLIRLVKLYKKSEPGLAHPGYDWADDDEVSSNVPESAVSKRLSEMTTRRVIMLVLAIMIILPFFNPEFYKSKLDSSAQYGANMIHKRWCDDMARFKPAASVGNEMAYLNSSARKVYEDDLLMYVYYHNWFCNPDMVPGSSTASSADSWARLFWIGVSPALEKFARFVLIQPTNDNMRDWNTRWEGKDWLFWQCSLPQSTLEALQRPWDKMTSCLSGDAHGVSLVDSVSPVLNCPESLRFSERALVFPQMTSEIDDDCGHTIFLFVFDRRDGAKKEAMLNLFQTLFICCLLGFGAMTFSNDANTLVLRPIERMICKLEKIRQKPFEAMTIGNAGQDREAAMMARTKDDKHSRASEVSSAVKQDSSLQVFSRVFLRRKRSENARKGKPTDPNEAVLLEQTVTKIGAMLALGLGQIGAVTLLPNVMTSETSSFNCILAGRSVEAVFAYCAIRDFDLVIEGLKDRVVLFVNRVAELVHGVANEYLGDPDKNLGNAFFLVWRLVDEQEWKRRRMVDLSILCAAKIVCTLRKSPAMEEYEGIQSLQRRIPFYKIRFHIALHRGHAIEGGIGSEFKIDPCFLGPDVDLPGILHASCADYGAHIVLSEALHQRMSAPVADKCRLIDAVVIPGPAPHLTLAPIKLYTLDMDDLAIEVDPCMPRLPLSKVGRFKAKMYRNMVKAYRLEESMQLEDFLTDDDFVAMRRKFTFEFFSRFAIGFSNYEGGEWEAAKGSFEATRLMLSCEDGPSATLLKFMKRHAFKAPNDWLGYREVRADHHCFF